MCNLMKTVKIIKCSDHSFWYANSIGKVFAVVDEFLQVCSIKGADEKYRFILNSDCEIIEPIPEGEENVDN